jgi:hypothetical protein
MSRSAMSDEIKGLLAAMEDAEKKSLMYSRAAKLLSMLEIALVALTAMTVATYLLLLRDVYWQLIYISAALAVAAIVADRLYCRYYYKAIKESDRLERLAYVASLSIRFDVTAAKLEKEIEGLKQELRKIRIYDAE